MSIQNIFDNATFITINKKSIAGQSISRSGHLKTADRGISFYTFTVGMHEGLTYSTNRDLLQDLDTQNIVVEANISLNNNSGMNYLTTYQGDLTSSDQGNLTTRSGTGDGSGGNIYINAQSVTGTSATYNYLFKKGDYLQPLGNTNTYRYVYQVTSDVAYPSGANSNITVPIHRGFIDQDGVDVEGSNYGLRIGNDVRFHVKALQQPDYSIVPHDRIAFGGDFVFMEVIT